VAQCFIALAFLQTFFDFGVEPGWPLPDPILFLWVFLISALPALAIGVLDGLARLPTHPGWSIPLRVFATLLVIVLGAGIAVLGYFFIPGDLGVFYEVDVYPGSYVGGLYGMEAALALPWLTARSVQRIHEARALRRQ
jgi:hypothetical protein